MASRAVSQGLSCFGLADVRNRPNKEKDCPLCRKCLLALFIDLQDDAGWYLRDFLGPDGLAALSTWLHDPGVNDPSEWAGLHVPYYELARRHLRSAHDDGFFAGMAEEQKYHQHVLEAIIGKYQQGGG